MWYVHHRSDPVTWDDSFDQDPSPLAAAVATACACLDERAAAAAFVTHGHFADGVRDAVARHSFARAAAGLLTELQLMTEPALHEE